MRSTAAALLLPLGACLSPTCERELGAEVGEQLLALAAEDQAARAALVGWSREHPGQTVPAVLVDAVTGVDARSSTFLHQLVDAHCWPRVSDVGADAAGAAWLLVQHADAEPGLQARALKLMAPLVDEGEAAPQDFALLTDRVRVAEGRPQRYGTQFRVESIDDLLHFFPATPIEDPARVDERRAEVGLGPLAEYEARLRELYGVPADAPGMPDG